MHILVLALTCGFRYIKRTQTPYAHPTANYHDIQAAIPAHMHKRHLGKGLWLAGRDFIVIAAFVTSAVYFETVSETIAGFITSPDSPTLFAAAKYAIKMPLWGAYWFLMGAQGAGVWFNGHEVRITPRVFSCIYLTSQIFRLVMVP